MTEYQVLPVRPEDLGGDEALGSKTKFWFRRDGQRWLFKEGREGTGEDWAEKVAAEVARFIDVPAATVEFVDFQGRRGCASLSFVRPEVGEGLIHGNEILAGMVLGYDRARKFRQSDHTLENIQTAIRNLFPDKAMHDGVLTILAGYLVLDALIGNTDRHHENWALLWQQVKAGHGGDNLMLRVAPSFDHASSLGRELQDAKRLNILRSGPSEFTRETAKARSIWGPPTSMERIRFAWRNSAHAGFRLTSCLPYGSCNGSRLGTSGGSWTASPRPECLKQARISRSRFCPILTRL